MRHGTRCHEIIETGKNVMRKRKYWLGICICLLFLFIPLCECVWGEVKEENVSVKEFCIWKNEKDNPLESIILRKSDNRDFTIFTKRN